MTRDNRPSRNFYLIFFLFFALRIIAFAFSKNYDGDAVLRIGLALNWMKNPSFVWHANPVTWVFGPLHYYLIALALTVYNNIIYAPRIVNLVLGVLSILPFYGIVRRSLDGKTADYACLFFAFHTLHVKYSSVATSETICTFVILCGTYFLLRYQQERKLIFYLLSIAMMNLAAMTRHEAPLFVLILGLILLLKDRKQPLAVNLTRVALFILLSMTFSLIWAWGDYIHHSDPLYSIKQAGLEHKRGTETNVAARGMVGNWLYNLAFWPAVILATLSPLVALLALIGLVRCLIGRRHLDLVALFVIPYLLYNYQAVVEGNLTPLARFALIFSVFFIPFAAAEIGHIKSIIGPGRRAIADCCVIAPMTAWFVFLALYGVEGRGYVADKLSSVSPLSRLPIYLDDVIHWIDTHAGPEDKIFIDSYGFQADVIAFYSRLPKQNLRTRWRDADEFLQYLNKERPNYLVYSPDGRLPAVLGLSDTDSLQVREGFLFRCRFTTSHYRIYELAPAGTSKATNYPASSAETGGPAASCKTSLSGHAHFGGGNLILVALRGIEPRFDG